MLETPWKSQSEPQTVGQQLEAEQLLARRVSMAQQIVTLNPGESEIVSFAVTPNEAKTYIVKIDGLIGSFVASYATLRGQVTNASNNQPISDVAVIYDGQSTTTDVNGEYEIPTYAKKIYVAFSHIAYYPYQTELTLVLGDNILNVNLTRAIIGQISLKEGYNRVTYTGESMTVEEAFASIAQYVVRVYRFVDSVDYEDICIRPVGCTKMMIPGDNYWVAVTQDCIWTF